MANETFDSVFGRATTQGADSSTAVDLPGQSVAGNVSSLLPDNLRAQASSGPAAAGWRVEVVTVPLAKPSRRRIRLMLRGQLWIVRQGQARASVSCESRRASADVVSRDTLVGPDGALPRRERRVDLSLTLPRSVRPRTLVRFVVLLEASVEGDGADAEAAIDTIDIQAL